jgi:hypothetical protein
MSDGAWKIIAISTLRRPTSASSPGHLAAPVAGARRPAATSSRLVLPLPERPVIAISSPARRVRLTSDRTARFPYATLIPSSSINDWPSILRELRLGVTRRRPFRPAFR